MLSLSTLQSPPRMSGTLTTHRIPTTTPQRSNAATRPSNSTPNHQTNKRIDQRTNNAEPPHQVKLVCMTPHQSDCGLWPKSFSCQIRWGGFAVRCFSRRMSYLLRHFSDLIALVRNCGCSGRQFMTSTGFDQPSVLRQVRLRPGEFVFMRECKFQSHRRLVSDTTNVERL